MSQKALAQLTCLMANTVRVRSVRCFDNKNNPTERAAIVVAYSPIAGRSAGSSTRRSVAVVAVVVVLVGHRIVEQPRGLSEQTVIEKRKRGDKRI